MKALFGGEKADQQNAFYNTIIECGKDYAKYNATDDMGFPHYEWIGETPITSMTVEFIDKLNELGFKIVKL